VPDNIVLIMRFHPVGGEDVSVVSEDFGGEREALEAIAQALDERRSLVLTQARYDREAHQSGVIINLANVVSVRVPASCRRPARPSRLQEVSRVHMTMPQFLTGIMAARRQLRRRPIRQANMTVIARGSREAARAICGGIIWTLTA
jgi:hypothetical protein